LNEEEKLQRMCCYYHINKRKDYSVIQYWYYFAYNPKLGDKHEHDFECVKIFIKDKIPRFITCNVHKWDTTEFLENGRIPDIKVCKDSHAMVPMLNLKLPTHIWKIEKTSGLKEKVRPTKSVEKDLREEIMRRPFKIINDDFKLYGDNNTPIIGDFYAPVLPWARIEYYFPEEALKKNEEAIHFLGEAYSPKRFMINFSEEFKRAKDLPPVEFFLGSKSYAYLLEKMGIASVEDLSRADPKIIRSQMRKMVQENKIDIKLPSTKEILQWVEISKNSFGNK
jgi:hypothetical protein